MGELSFNFYVGKDFLTMMKNLWTNMEWFPGHNVKWKNPNSKVYLTLCRRNRKYKYEHISAHLCKRYTRNVLETE